MPWSSWQVPGALHKLTAATALRPPLCSPPTDFLGIVGESGCGKSTAGRAILQLPPPTSGSIRLRDTELTGLAKLRRTRTQLQMILQDPISSLNPRRNVKNLVTEGTCALGNKDKAALQTRARETVRAVGLDPDVVWERKPRELSGGPSRPAERPYLVSTIERITGKVAFITGAARGQGRAEALRLAQEGADIIAVDICRKLDSTIYPGATPEDLKETVRLVEALGRRIVATEADVRDFAGLSAALQAGVAELGRLDVVIANAGVCSATCPGRSPRSSGRTIDVNLTGAFTPPRPPCPSSSRRPPAASSSS